MSEFLKNFRSTHSRYPGNKRNPYDGHYYPSQDRRNGNDRRNEQPQSQGKQSGTIYDKLEDFIPKLQSILETMAENQQYLIDLKERQAISGETLASAFKELVSILRSSGSDTFNAPSHEYHTRESGEAAVSSIKDLEYTEMKSSADEKRDVIKIMKKLRKKGGTYKEIANFLNENNIPTFSNKGHWHAQTIHRLCSRQ